MNISVLGCFNDVRNNTPVIYAQASIEEYLKLIGEEFYEFSIQRRRENISAYEQMKKDIVDGTLLPTITLSIEIEKAEEFKELVLNAKCDLNAISRLLIDAAPLNILDGLQRTYILKDIFDAGHKFLDNQTVHLEIRLESNLKNLIYRIIVLNAGQKPMSMRHQVEILSWSLKKTLEDRIPGLSLMPENESKKRTSARKFALDRISSAYHAFLIKSPEVDKQNLVAQKLSENTVLNQNVDDFGIQFEEFASLFEKYCELDDLMIKFQNENQEGGLAWLGNENTMNAFFASAADFSIDEKRKARMYEAIDVLIKDINNEKSLDVLGIMAQKEIIGGIPSRKINIGYATRKLNFNVFKEYFREEGQVKLKDIWAKEA